MKIQLSRIFLSVLIISLFNSAIHSQKEEDNQVFQETYITEIVEENPPPPPLPPKNMGVSKFISLENASKKPLKVKELYLSKRAYTEFPKEIQAFKNIEILNLNGNSIKEIPSFIGDLKKLKWLYLEYCTLESIPEELFTLDNLEVLVIRGNKIKNIPSSIKQLKKLTYLDISENEIESLPNTIAKLESLETFYCGYNLLTTFPKNIGASKSLKVIWAGHNKISTLPRSLLDLDSLEELYLVKNKLSSIPAFEKMKNLNRLDILYNNIQKEDYLMFFERAPQFKVDL